MRLISTPSSPVQPKSSINMDQSTSWNGSATALFVICWSCATVFVPEA